MREAGTAILIFTLVLSVLYLIVDNLILKQPMPPRIEKAYIRLGIAGAVLGFPLYFIGGL